MRKKGIMYIAIGLVLLAVVFGGMFLLSYEKEYGEYPLLSTPIGQLHFTERWEKYMQVESLPVDDGYAVRISAKIAQDTVPLYELYIGAKTDKGFLVGYVNDLKIWVDMLDAEPGSGWTKKNTDILYSIQEELDSITDQIVEMDGFRADGVISDRTEQQYGDYVLLRTPIGEILFNEQWKNQVAVRELDAEVGYGAEISAKIGDETVFLYAIYIGTEDQTGTLIGYVNSAEVRIAEPEFTPGSGWSDEDLNTVYSIQEALNDLTAQIMEMEDFSTIMPGNTAEENNGEYVLLSTPLGAVYFTQQWKNWMTVEEYSTDEGYAATVSVQTDSGKVKVYDLFVGTEADIGVLIGYVNCIEIRFEMLDVELDSGWTDADIDVVYSVQEELESLQDLFAEVPGFTAP